MTKLNTSATLDSRSSIIQLGVSRQHLRYNVDWSHSIHWRNMGDSSDHRILRSWPMELEATTLKDKDIL